MPAVTIKRSASGTVQVAPAEYLRDSWHAYKSACDRHGFRYDGKTQVGDVRCVPGLLDSLRASGFEVGIDDATRDALVALAETTTVDAGTTNERLDRIDGELAERGMALFPFQRDGVEWLAARRGALLADQMGLGKTIQTLAALPDDAPVMVVCPASLKNNWKTEANKWRPDYDAVVFSGRKSFRMPKKGEIVILNYDILPTVAKLEKHQTPQGLVLVADEAHNLKNTKTARTQKWRALSREAFAVEGRIWVLTGTPLLNNPLELWNVLKAAGIEMEAFSETEASDEPLSPWDNFVRLLGGYQGEYGYEWGEPLTDELVPYIHRVSLQRTREKVLPDLPVKRWQTFLVDATLDGSTQGLCDDAEQAIYDNNGSIPFEEISKARAALAAHKIPAMIEKVAEFEDAEEPLVVFSAHRAPIDTLAEREGWATITGSTSQTARTAIVERFQAGELTGIGLTIKAGGVGLTLTHASHALFVDLEWTPALNEQAEDRICRIGQSRGCVIQTLIARHHLDRRLQKLLQKKQAIIDGSTQAAATRERTAPEPPRPAAILASLKGCQTLENVTRGKTPPKQRKRRTRQPRKPGSKGRRQPTNKRPPEGPVEEWAASGLLLFAQLDPDRAREKNGVGFNVADGEFGHSLATQYEASGKLSTRQWAAAIRMLRKYTKQIGDCP